MRPLILSPALRRFAAACTMGLALAGALTALSAPARGDLQSRIGAARSREGGLQSKIGADDKVIAGYQGRIDDLQSRLSALQESLTVQQRLLDRLQARLRAARSRLVGLRSALIRDRAVLARQLVGAYESSRPDLVTVVLNARGFADLLDSADQIKRIEQQDARTTLHVKVAKQQVTDQARRLAGLEATQKQTTAAVSFERDQASQLRLAVVARQMVYVRARSRSRARLAQLRVNRRRLEKQLAAAQARAAAQQQVAFAGGPLVAPPPGGVGSFVSHGGDYGFFQAPGTNYAVGNEPALAARLDALGKALHLHLIGISGYRTPQHSVEVGGFANDPHTRGEASDTPGVEGVGEATLERFGLTRPFAGPAEADHIQLH